MIGHSILTTEKKNVSGKINVCKIYADSPLSPYNSSVEFTELTTRIATVFYVFYNRRKSVLIKFGNSKSIVEITNHRNTRAERNRFGKFDRAFGRLQVSEFGGALSRAPIFISKIVSAEILFRLPQQRDHSKWVQIRSRRPGTVVRMRSTITEKER